MLPDEVGYCHTHQCIEYWLLQEGILIHIQLSESDHTKDCTRVNLCRSLQEPVQMQCLMLMPTCNIDDLQHEMLLVLQSE